MSKYFNGFDGFDYRKVVWGKRESDNMGTEKTYDGIFRASGYGMSKKLKISLLIEEGYNATLFSDKLDGERPWDQEVDPFLKYEAKLYAKNWLSL